ncbi:hypothetical protein DPMN_056201 [Dreissena polymorpha]|uniref:Uncharacterized protein n=1 Tax=Dreissena polymorpha TaxID=45954 RepID=A0A9D4CU20_DREPO|nr:hypothetical protein DPMN_056201 [Dreissena polymorpha]
MSFPVDFADSQIFEGSPRGMVVDSGFTTSPDRSSGDCSVRDGWADLGLKFHQYIFGREVLV